jgi:hypothetical protein
MQEFSGQVASITVVDDPSWSGSVVRITLTDPNLSFYSFGNNDTPKFV